MAIITLDYFNEYTGDQNADDDAVALKTDLIDTAQSIIEQWLGYPLASTDYIYDERAIYKKYIKLAAPAISVTVVKIGDIETSEYTINSRREYIYFDEIVMDRDVYVEYSGGLSVIPAAMKIVCCKIASLLLMETNKQIGVTGVSMSDGMSHQYVSYTNYTKHLKPLSKWRILPI